MKLPASIYPPPATPGRLSQFAHSCRSSRKLIALLTLFASAYATTVVPMSVERLTALSSHVVVAHAVKSWSAWNAQHTMIETYTQFSVDTSLKGASTNTITVRQPGGSADGYTQHVSGVRPWTAGESAVLFLQPSMSNDGTFIVTGLMQGNFRVHHSASGTTIADNGVPSPASEPGEEVDSFNPANKSLHTYTGNRMNLDDLVQRVRTAVGNR